MRGKTVRRADWRDARRRGKRQGFIAQVAGQQACSAATCVEHGAHLVRFMRRRRRVPGA
jgi:hypothetical protein